MSLFVFFMGSEFEVPKLYCQKFLHKASRAIYDTSTFIF